MEFILPVYLLWGETGVLGGVGYKFAGAAKLVSTIAGVKMKFHLSTQI